VTFAGKAGNYGLLVCIEHPNQWETRYAHLSEIFVKKGKIVKKGEIIGKVGDTGNATAPHLHFEVRRKGIPINPNIVIPQGK
jgi:murein DD-endopeptidase MepM/ murein hydrolase activator NlpD